MKQRTLEMMHMNNTHNLIRLVLAAALVLLGGRVFAENPPLDNEMVFSPIDVTEAGGTKIKNGIFNYQGQQLAVRLDGLSVGGALGNGISVTGRVEGMQQLGDLEGTYHVQLQQEPGDGASSQRLWLISDRGVRIELGVDNPDFAIAAGGDDASVSLAQGEKD